VIKHSFHVAQSGTWSPIIFFENSVDPASVGDVRHPASGLAQCRLALLTRTSAGQVPFWVPK